MFFKFLGMNQFDHFYQISVENNNIEIEGFLFINSNDYRHLLYFFLEFRNQIK